MTTRPLHSLSVLVPFVSLSVIRSDNERRQLEALRAEREEPGRAEQDSPEVKVPHRKLTRKVPAGNSVSFLLHG